MTPNGLVNKTIMLGVITLVLAQMHLPALSARLEAFSAINSNYPPPITQSEVKVFLKRLERLTNRKNYLPFVKAIAWDGVVQETNPAGETYYFDRDSYMDKKQGEFKDLTEYQFRQSIESVDINGKRAYVRATAYQKMEGPNGSKVQMIREMGIVEKRKGKLYFTLLATRIQEGEGTASVPAGDAPVDGSVPPAPAPDAMPLAPPT